jgi:protein SDA1
MTKIMVTAVKFFLGKDDDEENKDGDSDDEGDRLPTLKNTALANRVNKKSRKRERLLENLKKAHKRKKKKEKVECFNFSALHLIHDPQGFAEKLFKRLDSLRERFEVKLLFLDLVSRLIGTHELFVLGYYSYIARFLNPHQREVVHMLQYAAQSAHEHVPPDAIEPVVRAILNNFVTERNTSEVMAIGLNAMRELCKRCPLALDETTVRDLAGYKTYKDKAVMMAARSLIALYRMTYPHLLHKKDRGRPTEAQAELLSKRYGELVSNDYVPGAEELGVDAPEDEEKDADDSDEEGWEDVIHSSDEEAEDGEESEGSENEGDVDEEDESCSKENGEEAPKAAKASSDSKSKSLDEKKKHAAEVTTSRILTDADFKRIDAAQLKKQVQAFRKGSNKRKHEEMDSSLVGSWGRDELVDLASIEMIHKKRKHDKESRMATIMEGREGRDKFGSRKAKMNEFASSTHKEKARKKNFMMVKHKLKAKAKKSFTEKQRDLKKSLIRSRKFK